MSPSREEGSRSGMVANNTAGCPLAGLTSALIASTSPHSLRLEPRVDQGSSGSGNHGDKLPSSYKQQQKHNKGAAENMKETYTDVS